LDKLFALCWTLGLFLNELSGGTPDVTLLCGLSNLGSVNEGTEVAFCNDPLGLCMAPATFLLLNSAKKNKVL
jgi:hypothetical protein